MARFSVSYVYKIVDKYTKPLRKISKQTMKYRKALKSATLAAKKLALQLNKIALRSFKNIALSAGRLIGRIGALTGVVGLLSSAVGAFSAFRMVDSFATATDELAKFSRQVGLSGQDLRTLQFVAERQGVTQEALAGSIRGLSKALGEAKIDRGPLVEYLKKSNPALLKQLKLTTDLKDAFNLVMTAMSELESPAERAALAQAAFTEVGLTMTRIAEAGAPAVQELRKRFGELADELTPQDLANAEAYADAMTDFREAFKGWSDVIAKQLVPVITDIVNSITTWAAANRELIEQRFGEFLDAIGQALEKYSIEDILASIGKAVQDFDAQKFIKQFGDILTKIDEVATETLRFIEDYWKPMVLAIVGLSFAPALVALGGLAAAFGPIGVAIVAATGTLIYFWDELEAGWRKFDNWWNNTRGNIREMIGLSREGGFTFGLEMPNQEKIDKLLKTAKELGVKVPMREIPVIGSDQMRMVPEISLNEIQEKINEATAKAVLSVPIDPKSLFDPYAMTREFERQAPGTFLPPTGMGFEGADGTTVDPYGDLRRFDLQRRGMLLPDGQERVQVDSNVTGTININVPTGVTADADIRTDDGLPFGTNIVSSP